MATYDDAAPARAGRLRWSARDVLLVTAPPAVLGVVCLLWTLAQGQFSAPVARLFVGVYFLGGLLAMALVRKPGAALAGELMLALGEVIAVNSFLRGVVPHAYCTAESCGDYLHAGLVQGLGLELGFLLFGYRNWRVPVFMLAGLLGMLAPMLESVIQTGRYMGGDPLVTIVSLFSASVLAGGLCGIISRRVHRDEPAEAPVERQAF